MEKLKKMLGIHRSNPTSSGHLSHNIKLSLLPSPLPNWPPGKDFGTGKINLGHIEVVEISKFEFIWGSNSSKDKKNGVSFYKPVGIPEQFFSLGHYCQPNDAPLDGFVLVAKDLMINDNNNDVDNDSEPRLSPALESPLDYSLVWHSGDDTSDRGKSGYFWLPVAPAGYKALGFVVTNNSEKPDLADVRCVREDLVDKCEAYKLLIETHSTVQDTTLKVLKTRPANRGMLERGVSVGTFFCTTGEDTTLSCLKNLDRDLNAMPNLEQIHALIQNYGPTVFFHPEEVYFPSSVSWYFTNGAQLHRAGQSKGEPVDAEGTNLPSGGTNDGEFWLDLPADEDQREVVKQGNLESAELYVHVKPALGGTFTDFAMWIFYPFNGPASLRIISGEIHLGRIGEHVGDWEHFTLRVSNFTGKLDSIYFSEHSGGVWVNASELEFIQGNKAAVYSSKSGHGSYPDAAAHLQELSKTNVGLINDCKKSEFFVDSSTKYQVVAAEYLGGTVTEPNWLQYMRKWGPDIVYDTKVSELKGSLRNIADKLPKELFRQEGPTGPKEKNMWSGDERW